MEEVKYNPTCAVTGEKENLQMYAHRDENGNMIGWFFLKEGVNPKGLRITLEYSE